MQTDILIIGQGLAGTWLSFWLQKAGADFLVIDEGRTDTASRVASGIINPVTGRRMVKTWMADTLMPFAVDAYGAMSEQLNKQLLTSTEIFDFFSSPDRRLSFQKRAAEGVAFLQWPKDDNEWTTYFDYPFGYGIIKPVYRIDVQSLLSYWRKELLKKNRLIEGRYEPEYLNVNNQEIEYNPIKAKQLVFCDGIAAMKHDFFKMLPFAFNKGEALLASIPGLPKSAIYKKTNVILPWKDDIFWVGSNYDRDYVDEKPTEEFLNATTNWLNAYLKLPFLILDHLAAIRPTTVERRPFAGVHPVHHRIAILNGLGTKGVSLAPYLARQLCGLLLTGAPILPEVDVSQYSRVLQRGK